MYACMYDTHTPTHVDGPLVYIMSHVYYMCVYVCLYALFVYITKLPESGQ